MCSKRTAVFTSPLKWLREAMGSFPQLSAAVLDLEVRSAAPCHLPSPDLGAMCFD